MEVDDADAVTKAALRRAEQLRHAGRRADPRRERSDGRHCRGPGLSRRPINLVSEVPGVDLAQASWSSEPIDYDPDSPEWDLDEDDGGEDDDEEVGVG